MLLRWQEFATLSVVAVFFKHAIATKMCQDNMHAFLVTTENNWFSHTCQGVVKMRNN